METGTTEDLGAGRQRAITCTTPDTNLRTKSMSLRQNEAIKALEFPEISLQEFKELPYSVQKNLIARNRIINTDTYNRTMDELSTRFLASVQKTASDAGLERKDQATFALQLRRSPSDYLVACGIEEMVEELTLIPINRAELKFAKEYYAETNVPFFNEKRWEDLIERNDGKLPFEIKGVKDGTIVLPGEPLLTVKGPEELIAHFEHVFHRVFYSTLVATKAHVIEGVLGDSNRFIEVGKRGAVTEEQHLQALKAAYVGGGFTLTSNDAGTIILPLKDTGTIGHRYIQRFSSEEASFRHAIDILDSVTLLVDLVDTYKGIDLAFDLKKEYRESGKRIWVRLDSGDILDQVRYFLTGAKEHGFNNPVLDKVVVEGIDGVDEIRAIEKMIIKEFGRTALKQVVYGAGGLLISDQTSRSDASSGFKISEYSDENGVLQPTMKFSNSKGKISHPGEVRLAIADGKRVIAQAGEALDGAVLELFEPLYSYGITFCGGVDSARTARERLVRQTELLDIYSLSRDELKGLRGQASQQTDAKITKIYDKYGLAQLAS